MAANTNRKAPYTGRYGKGIPRPQMWMYQDPVVHSMHLPFLRAKAQANFRDEGWTMTLEEFVQLWRDDWHNRGRKAHNMCMSRLDITKPWSLDNCRLITRLEHLNIQAKLKIGRKYAKTYSKMVVKK